MPSPTHQIPETETSHPANPVPEAPKGGLPEFHFNPPVSPISHTSDAEKSGDDSLAWSDTSSVRSDDFDAPASPTSLTFADTADEIVDKVGDLPAVEITFDGQTAPTSPTILAFPETVKENEEKIDDDLPAVEVTFEGHKSPERRLSTTVIPSGIEDIARILGDDEQTGTQIIQKACCGGNCCFLKDQRATEAGSIPVVLPDNDAFRSLDLKLGALCLDTELTNIAPLPETTVSLEPLPNSDPRSHHISKVYTHPPEFVQPHPPYNTFSAPVHHVRELTKPGAEKRTFHFDIDVTGYPEEGGADFKVGGAIGICPPNDPEIVDDIFDALGIPKFVRDRPVLLRTSGGRWPTIWGDDKARELVTTRRELLTWCSDVQSDPPTKQLFRVLADYADDKNEEKILLYLASAQGQPAFCDLRTGPYVTLSQLLRAFPSSQPPLASLFSVLKQLRPRFYSLSNDPDVSSERDGLSGRRLIELAVTVHEMPDWKGGKRTGMGSGYLGRIAQQFMASAAEGAKNGGLLECGHAAPATDIRIPMFRGLMANPLSREFINDGPMVLIGAGVGVAPFRGFIMKRLRNANCANKVWLIQGVRDSSKDELYAGELGHFERDIKTVVQSRKEKREPNEARYVQDEVRKQADVVWHVINAVDGRVFVCGSNKGMGDGVLEALVDVAQRKGGLNREQAEQFWAKKAEDRQYIMETS